MAEDKFVLARSPSQRALEEADSDDDEADPQVVAVLVTAAEQVQHLLTAQPVYSQEKTGPELDKGRHRNFFGHSITFECCHLAFEQIRMLSKIFERIRLL